MKHKVRNIHFVGIGGSGMSGIAEVLVNQGYAVSGSDLGVNAATARLQKMGARVMRGHDAGHVAGAADCFHQFRLEGVAIGGEIAPVEGNRRAGYLPVTGRCVLAVRDLARCAVIAEDALRHIHAVGKTARRGMGRMQEAEGRHVGQLQWV